MDIVRIKGFKDIEDAFRKPQLKQSLYNEGGVLMDKVLVTLHGDEHRTRRSVESRLFKRNFFKQYEAEVFPKLLQETLDRYLLDDRADFKDLGYRIMMHIALAFSGIDRQDNSDEEADRLHHLLSQLGMAATLGQYQGDREAVRAEVRSALADFETSFFKPSRARREALVARFNAGEIGEDELPRDILTILVMNNDKLQMPDDLMMREVAFFYLASAHTSVHTMTHALHEVFTWYANREEDATTLANDPLTLQKFVMESMRLHPSSPESWRQTDEDVSIGSDLNLAAGTSIVLDLQSANRDPEIFGEDAAEFNPFREREARLNPAGLSFGGGIHVCLGMNLVTGTILKSDADYDPDNHQLGTIALILKALLSLGAQPDPERPAQKMQNTQRDVWEVYPLVFNNRTA